MNVPLKPAQTQKKSSAQARGGKNPGNTLNKR